MRTLFLLFLAWVAICSAVYFVFPNHWVFVGFAFVTLSGGIIANYLRSNP